MEKFKAFLDSFFPPTLGKSPGFIVLALVEVVLAVTLIYIGKDVGYLPAIYGAINVPVYGAGAWKASSDNKVIANGKAPTP